MSNFSLFKRLLKPYKELLALSIILSVIFAIFNALSVYLTIPLIKTLFESNDVVVVQPGEISSYFDYFKYQFESYIFSGTDKIASLAKVCMLMLVVYLLKNISGYLQSIVTAYGEKRLANSLRMKLYERYNTLSLKYITRKRSGEIITRIITDTNTVQTGIAVTFTNMLKDPLTILVFLAMAFYLSWKLTLISLLIVPISVGLILFIGKKLNKYSRKVMEKISDFTSTITETIYGSRIIRAFSMENYENNKFRNKLNEYFRLVMKHAVYNDLSRPVTEVISVAVGVSIIWFGGQEVFIHGTLSSEEFIGFLIVIFQLISPIKDLGTINNRIQETSVSANRIYEIIDLVPDITDKPNAIEKNTFDSTIEFKNVSFYYDESYKLVLDSINLKINKDERIAIVGPSGVGKSTMIDLLPRFYDVRSGEILIDSVNIKDIKLKNLRNLFSIVTQEIILFNDTILNNIAYGLDMKELNIDKVYEAAKNANAHDFIMQTENGYKTIIGERGTKLSGGQKQRIAIARALLKNSPILIFDEATSALDNESELLIQDAIDTLIKGKTSIVIAHRLTTIKDSDRIIVLEKGKIAEIGSHDELLSMDESIYKKLYELSYQ